MSGRKRHKRRSAKVVKLFRKQKGRCYLCGSVMTLQLRKPNTATIEHVIPKSKSFSGYAEKRKNLKAACSRCNYEKGNREPWEYFRDKRLQEEADDQLPYGVLRGGDYFCSPTDNPSGSDIPT